MSRGPEWEAEAVAQPAGQSPAWALPQHGSCAVSEPPDEAAGHPGDTWSSHTRALVPRAHRVRVGGWRVSPGWTTMEPGGPPVSGTRGLSTSSCPVCCGHVRGDWPRVPGPAAGGRKSALERCRVPGSEGSAGLPGAGHGAALLWEPGEVRARVPSRGGGWAGVTAEELAKPSGCALCAPPPVYPRPCPPRAPSVVSRASPPSCTSVPAPSGSFLSCGDRPEVLPCSEAVPSPAGFKVPAGHCFWGGDREHWIHADGRLR